ncbi:MAG: lysine--tRNA ligase [Spirochaetaceae bacterium]|nr:lysine--tRNA ligase [Spirochaetaceae bacterium]
MSKVAKGAVHWADATAERIVRQRGERDCYVLAAGITPSGTVHFGNMREIITPELIARALRRTGYGVRFIYLWDDYDRFRKVPTNLPGDGWERYIGAPLSEIPDPYGAAASYARHFAGVFEEQMARLGIEPEWISQAEMYGGGAYAEGVRTALRHRQRLRELLDRQRTTPLAADWWPVEVYCACGAGAAGTAVLSWDGDYGLTYRCAACDAERTADLRRGDGVKLGWRVDWPMRWAHHGVDFEAAGKDHHTAGGSWETAAPIAGEVFGRPPPATLKFDWINVRGVGTMASSSGQLISPADALAVYQPEVVRYLFARTRPDREFEISFDLDVLKTYEDYDRAGRVGRGTEPAAEPRRIREGRAIELSEVDPDAPLPAGQVEVSFRHLCSLLQIHDGDIEGVVASLLNGAAGSAAGSAAGDRLQDRARCAWHWITTHAPEGFRFRLRDPGAPPVPVSAPVAAAVAGLRERLASGRGPAGGDSSDAKAVNQAIYDVAAAHGMEARELFAELYRVLIDQDRGPRLAEFILTIGVSRIDALLANVTARDG